jgi:hypothetical protein
VGAQGRIEIQCPLCGSLQLDPELAQSTNCRDAAATFTWREVIKVAITFTFLRRISSGTRR